MLVAKCSRAGIVWREVGERDGWGGWANILPAVVSRAFAMIDGTLKT